MPSIVYVGSAFQVAVLAIKSSSAPIKNARIFASVVPSGEVTNTLSQANIEDLIQQLSSGRIFYLTMTLIKIYSRVRRKLVFIDDKFSNKCAN